MKVSVELNKVIMAENEKEISNSQFTVTKVVFEIDVDVDDYYFLLFPHVLVRKINDETIKRYHDYQNYAHIVERCCCQNKSLKGKNPRYFLNKKL